MQQPIPAADGTDFLHEKHGRKWRVRVRVNSELATNAPINGAHEIEPSGLGISVSVALLDDSGEVARTPAGKLRIFDAHVVTFQAASLGSDDPEAVIAETVEQRIDEAERQLIAKDALQSALAAHLKVAK